MKKWALVFLSALGVGVALGAITNENNALNQEYREDKTLSQHSKISKFKFGGAIVFDEKRPREDGGRYGNGNNLKLKRLRLNALYNVSDNFSFSLRENLVNDLGIAETFFIYKFNENSSLRLGYASATFSLEQAKGFNNVSFTTPNMERILPNIRRNLLGATLFNDYNNVGIWLGIYGGHYLDSQANKKGRCSFKRDGDRFFLYGRAYKMLHRANDEVFQLSLSGLWRQINKSSENKMQNDLSRVSLYSFETLFQRKMFSLETTRIIQKLDYDGFSRKNSIYSTTFDVEAMIVLTGEQKEYDKGAIHGINVKNGLSKGGIGAFETGVRLGIGRVNMTNINSRGEINEGRAFAFNWMPEKRVKALFNIGKFKKKLSNGRVIKGNQYETTFKAFF
jgi:phosphate-selective porin